jgi:hypothetical protein
MQPLTSTRLSVMVQLFKEPTTNPDAAIGLALSIAHSTITPELFTR